MNASGTLPPEALSWDLRPRTIQELRTFAGVTEQEQVDSAKINAVLQQVTSVADELFVTAIETRNAAEFSSVAASLFNDYVRMLRVKADILKVTLRTDRHLSTKALEDSLSELESEVVAKGPQQFGTAVSDQAIFTIWTLKKTARLIGQLGEPEVINYAAVEEAKSLRQELYSEFALHSAWAQFHLECLATSMRLNRVIHPEVLPAILDGLRAEVNAYAIAKHMLNLHLPPVQEPAPTPYKWDEEDEELLASSMRELSDGLDEY